MAKELNVSKNNKPVKIQVVAVNKPTKQQGEQRIKELSEFLAQTWHMPMKSE